MHRKRVSSAVLLCYGQMAVHAGKQVLPWVDNITSRTVYHFSCSTYVSPGLALGSGAEELCACMCTRVPYVCVCVCAGQANVSTRTVSTSASLPVTWAVLMALGKQGLVRSQL